MLAAFDAAAIDVPLADEKSLNTAFFKGYRQMPAFVSEGIGDYGLYYAGFYPAWGALGSPEALASALLTAGKLTRALVKRGRLRELGAAYLRFYFRDNLALGRERMSVPVYLGLCVTHWHCYRIAESPMSTGGSRRVFRALKLSLCVSQNGDLTSLPSLCQLTWTRTDPASINRRASSKPWPKGWLPYRSRTAAGSSGSVRGCFW